MIQTQSKRPSRRQASRFIALSAAALAAGLSLASAEWMSIGSVDGFRLVHEDIPEKGSDKCVVFKLLGPDDKLLWSSCDWQKPRAFPWPTWSGGVVQAPEGKKLFVVIARSVSFATSIRVYEVDPAKPSVRTPSYDGKGRLKNSQELHAVTRAPASALTKDFASTDVKCAMNLRITSMNLTGSVLRVSAQGESMEPKKPEMCSPKMFEFDTKSKQWKGESAVPKK